MSSRTIASHGGPWGVGGPDGGQGQAAYRLMNDREALTVLVRP
jgi:hypothetical protein